MRIKSTCFSTRWPWSTNSRSPTTSLRFSCSRSRTGRRSQARGCTPRRLLFYGSCQDLAVGDHSAIDRGQGGLPWTAKPGRIYLVRSTGSSDRIVHEAVHCSARLDLKKIRLILDLRFSAHSELMQYSHVVSQLLERFEGERLGKRAPRGLARKARGRS